MPISFTPAAQLDERVWQRSMRSADPSDRAHPGLERAHAGHWLPQEFTQARRANLQKGRASLGQQLERLTEAHLQAIIPCPGV